MATARPTQHRGLGLARSGHQQSDQGWLAWSDGLGVGMEGRGGRPSSASLLGALTHRRAPSLPSAKNRIMPLSSSDST